MDFREIFNLSFDALKERKVRSALTIVMVMVGSPSESSNNANNHTEEAAATTSSESSLNPIYLAQDMAIVWVISVALSILAGLFPAWKASRYLPIEALRSQ